MGTVWHLPQPIYIPPQSLPNWLPKDADSTYSRVSWSMSTSSVVASMVRACHPFRRAMVCWGEMMVPGNRQPPVRMAVRSSARQSAWREASSMCWSFRGGKGVFHRDPILISSGLGHLRHSSADEVPAMPPPRKHHPHHRQTGHSLHPAVHAPWSTFDPGEALARLGLAGLLALHHTGVPPQQPRRTQRLAVGPGVVYQQGTGDAMGSRLGLT